MWIPGWLPWRGESTAAYKNSKTGVVFRLGRGNILYPASEHLAAQFEPTNKEQIDGD